MAPLHLMMILTVIYLTFGILVLMRMTLHLWVAQLLIGISGRLDGTKSLVRSAYGGNRGWEQNHHDGGGG